MTNMIRKRRFLETAAVLAFMALAAAVPAGAEESAGALARVEAYLNNLSTLTAEFTQYGGDGSVVTGRLYLKRPDELRVEYDPPSPLLIVAKGGRLTYYDRELRQAEHVRIEDSPAAVLLRRELAFGTDILARRVTEEGGVIRIMAENARDPGAGFITLVFTKTPFELRQWVVRDGQGLETRVVLDGVHKGGPLDPKLFVFNEPVWNKN
jgi:outer membrane lipoprotein-sorting protein